VATARTDRKQKVGAYSMIDRGSDAAGGRKKPAMFPVLGVAAGGRDCGGGETGYMLVVLREGPPIHKNPTRACRCSDERSRSGEGKYATMTKGHRLGHGVSTTRGHA